MTKLCRQDTQDLGSVSAFKKIAKQISLTTTPSSARTEFDDLMTPDETPSQQNIWKLLPSTKLNGCHIVSPDAEDSIFSFPSSSPLHEAKMVDENSNMAAAAKRIGDPSSSENAAADAANGETHKQFLDTHAMCSSPSANYYKPTDEPEPWDLTQLNIEASVMCLVSKVKFLCGKCNSPAVRLRTQRTIVRSQNSFRKDPKRQVMKYFLYSDMLMRFFYSDLTIFQTFCHSFHKIENCLSILRD